MSNRMSFAQFVREAFPVVCPDVEYNHNWHISAISAEYDRVMRGETYRLMLNMPPGAMSTLIGVFFAAWVWSVDPTKRIANVSSSGCEASWKREMFKTLVRSNWYRKTFIYLRGIDSLGEGIQNTKGGSMLFISVGGVLLGMHPHFMIIDSIHKSTDVYSSKIMDKTIRWFVATLASKGVLQKMSVVITMPRLATNDLCGVILGESPSLEANVECEKWRHVCLPMRYEQSHRYRYEYDMRSMEGELLWPDYQTEEIVKQRQRMMELDKDQANVHFQFQQNPLADSNVSKDVSSNVIGKYIVELSGYRMYSETVEAESEAEAIAKVADKLKQVKESTTAKASSVD